MSKNESYMKKFQPKNDCFGYVLAILGSKIHEYNAFPDSVIAKKRQEELKKAVMVLANHDDNAS